MKKTVLFRVDYDGRTMEKELPWKLIKAITNCKTKSELDSDVFARVTLEEETIQIADDMIKLLNADQVRIYNDFEQSVIVRYGKTYNAELDQELENADF